MQVNPSLTHTEYSAFVSRQPGAPAGDEFAVRSDLPPPAEAAPDEGVQNQSFSQQGSPDSDVSKTGQESQDNNSSGKNTDELEQRQQEQDENIIRQLKARDREVRVHEAAHAAVGGKYAGSPSLQYKRGPDGVNYAVSGEVSISTSKVPNNPEATIEKARVIRAAALAPAEPSAQDRQVATQASQLELEAKADLQQEKVEQEQQAKEARETEGEKADQAQPEEAVDNGGSADEDEKEAKSDANAVDAEKDQAEAEVGIAAQDSPDDSGAATGQGAQESDSEEKSNLAADSDKPNAKEQLEAILLGNRSIPEQLNQSGLVDTDTPYGKSGFFELIV